ncbi:RHS repeat-associated core domain-containing protein [Lysinibacillus sp. Y5S-8]|uniref:RHS repeat domain-containing protein n=1 Tax=Lysinibacillus sp. Y5S-8 TaxID=3122488 RepID=UPI0030CAF339
MTWVFNEGFVPSAKITNEGHYSIISDYLGTPVEAYDEQGHKVWSAELDVYGRMKEFTGEKDFIPFRYQGQYEYVEIGLYYNRFRYYDPEQGNYIQIDPIGLAGGNPTLYGYVRNSLLEIDPFGLNVNRGRIQAQGTKLEESISWSQDNPPTVAEALVMVDELESKLSNKEKKLRKNELNKARKFIKDAGKSGGVDASVSKTFLVKGTAHERIDIEVIKGKAFVPDLIDNVGGDKCRGK